ncbi:hypothetical protein UC34_05845 [Pandoraea vervacti]|uniref:Uncharacterized protein n=2 Tax=Pandoraea vervacti TaxID=656178 RepID=A0ABN4FMH6_9BURK|nr:hypothetical protein UC34_05845 [Pandoraea vervacti]
MTLRGGNPQALMLPPECLHHYHVDPHADAAQANAMAARPGAVGRAAQWLRAFVRNPAQTRHG